MVFSNKKQILSILVLSLSLTSFTSAAKANDALGTLVGAAGGAWAGSSLGKGSGRVVSIAVGTLLGAAVGHSLSQHGYSGGGYGNTYNHHHRHYHHAGHHRRHHPAVYEENRYISNYYVNNVSYDDYPRTYTGSGFRRNGDYCREFTQTISVGGRLKEGYGIACQRPDGSWEIESE